MDNCEGTSLSEMIARISGKARMPVSIETGTVTQANPLKITLEADTKIQLTAVDLVVPENMRAKSVSVGGVSVTIQKALAKDDKVYMLCYANGKKYLVLSRI